MADWHAPQGPFDIPDIPNYVPRRLKPWIFIFFVVIIQLSGGVYLAAVSDMVGTTALMQQDILMAGYASLIGMAMNFAVMFRIKFRFSNRTQLLVAATVLIAANLVCAYTESVAMLVATCLVAGWFRMQATLACNSTIQLWITPRRDMSVFFCYVFLMVDGAIQLSGLATAYVAFFAQWEYMQWIIIGALALLMLMVVVLVKPVRGPMFIPLLGIDWLGAVLWTGFMTSFAFVCVYGDFYDWWEASEIRFVTVLGLACLALNLWRMTFLHHPYITRQALTNRCLARASMLYLVFFVLLAPEHVMEHALIGGILGYDSVNMIDLNWFVLAGNVSGAALAFFTFARRKWRYKTMAAIVFALATVYLAYFYFVIDYRLPREALFAPLFCRGAATTAITIVFLTSIVQSGMPFQIFPQAVTLNGFTRIVMSVTFGPALIGEVFDHVVARNAALLGANLTASNPALAAALGAGNPALGAGPEAAHAALGQLYGMVQAQAMMVAMKEVYGYLLIMALTSLALILAYRSSLRPWAIFPKWKNIRRALRHALRSDARSTAPRLTRSRTPKKEGQRKKKDVTTGQSPHC